MASESVFNFSAAVANYRSDIVHIKMEESSEIFKIPLTALRFLSQILSCMAEGKAISLTPPDSELCTQEAVDILNVSKLHIMGLLETGVIPLKKVESSRKIPLEVLLSYEMEQKLVRKSSLELMAHQAQELNLGYES
ncbi:hypothetical protein SAMN04487995_3567 [Dyadobacter koreensis]|uniref:DNA binding domain-containing protein, excisionase family n=1 Tax=Dyadobacter koreensis TaxID=408657 RepID=A0A1H6WLG8_9BACT|nr:hypothetical protein [Dyadobacter koreensis]SEJ16576.1 hypothetical protein SAMN04487995_3567 [Dyadobacter koreensis]